MTDKPSVNAKKVNKEQVINCYRYILGREPEDEAIVEAHAALAGDFETLRNTFFQSGEFKAKLAAVARNKVTKKGGVKWEDSHNLEGYQRPLACTSMLCNASFYDAPFYQFWIRKLKEKPQFHRKQWELVYIAQTLWENGYLKPGKRGLVFGCGQEPLPDLFASYGVEILATDLNPEDERANGWVATGQNSLGGVRKLGQRSISKPDEFARLVKYRNVDMNDLPDDLAGFDFCWSTCAYEHLGSLRKGMDFVKNSLKCLRKGGLAVHTTEFNLDSNEDTIESPSLSVYRKKDIEKLIEELQVEGNYVYPMNWHRGESPVDNYVDLPPYGQNSMHLRLALQNWACTSVGLIVEKRGK